MSDTQSESSHLLVNSEISLDDDHAEDTADTSLYTNKEIKRKLKFKDFVNISILCIDTICQGMGYALISSFYPLTAQTKGLSIADVGIVMSALPMAQIVFGILISHYIARIGTRKLLLGSLLIQAISLVPFSFVMLAPPGFAFYATSIVCRVGQGIAYVSSQLSAFAIAAGDYNDRMSTVMGLLEMAVGVGLSAGPAIGGLLYQEFGFKIPFYFLAGLSLLCFVVTYFWVHPEYSYEAVDSSGNYEDETPSRKMSLTIKTLHKVPGVILPLLVCITIFTNYTFFDVALAPFLNKVYEMDPALIGGIFLSTAGIYAFLAPVVGYVVDKKGHNGLCMATGCFIVVPAFMFIGPTNFFNMDHHLWLTILGLAIVYIGCAFMYVPVMGSCFQIALDNDVEDNEATRSFISSTFVLTGNIGNLLGPLIGGFLVNAFGFEETGFIFGTTSFVVGAIIAIYFIYSARRKSTKQSGFTEIVE